MEYSIIANNLSKTYKDFKLNNVSFKLPNGSIMGLVGENGAGKTTLIKLLLGIQDFEKGNSKNGQLPCEETSLSILGYDMEKLPISLKSEIGVVLDDCYFSEVLNAVQINKVMQGIYENWDTNCFNRYVEYFNPPPTLTVKKYSKGMKMKLSLSVALSHNAKLLILDEPTSGLDPVVRDEILDVFMEFIQDEEHSILLSSHITSDLEKICDYITFIHQGEIILSDVKDDILENCGILKCSEEDFKSINSESILGYKRNSFGITALVKRNEIQGPYAIDPASLEDILLYSVKGV